MKHKRRLARTFGAILATALLLSSCGKTSQENGFETYILPKKYLEECDAVGTIETLTYHVESYAVEAKEGLVPGSLYEDKTLYVYLPAGYDPEQRYNILYLLHGSNETQEYWFYTQKTLGTYFRQQMKIDNPHFTANYTKNVIDQLFAKGECEPFIIVTPSYFSTLRGETDYGDSRDDTMFWLDSFEQELRNDIIPLVESTYLTYTNGDTSPQGIQASREHRAIAGFSRGSRFITRIALPDFVYICGSRYVDRAEEVTTVKVYSNQERVALYANGELVEEKAGDKVFQFQVPLEGTVELEAEAGRFTDRCLIRRVDTPNPAYKLQGKSSNSANWV